MTTRMTPEELAELRADLDVLLPDTITVRRRTGTTWATVGTWKGRWRLGGATDVVAASGAAEALDANVTVRLEAGADVRRGDNLFIGGYPDGQRLEAVLVSPAPRAHWTVMARMEEAP